MSTSLMNRLTVLDLSSPTLLKTRKDRAAIRRTFRLQDHGVRQEKALKAQAERQEVRTLVREIRRPVTSRSDYDYRSQKITRLWELAFS